MAKTMKQVYDTPRDWHYYIKRYVVVQSMGATYTGWLNSILDDKRIIGLDEIQENLIWEAGASPNTVWLPQRDTLLCEYMEVSP